MSARCIESLGLYRASKSSSVLSQQWNGSVLYTQFSSLLLLPTAPFYSLILVYTLYLPVTRLTSWLTLARVTASSVNRIEISDLL